MMSEGEGCADCVNVIEFLPGEELDFDGFRAFVF